MPAPRKPIPVGPQNITMRARMSPAQARDLARKLLGLANQLDKAPRKQAFNYVRNNTLSGEWLSIKVEKGMLPTPTYP